MRRLLAASRRRDGCPPSTACLARWRTVAESLGHQHHQIRDYPAFGGSLRHHVGTIKYVGIPYLPSSPPARCSGRAVRAVCSRVTPKIHCIGLHLLVPRARGRIAHETLPVGRPAPSRACVRTVRKTPTLAAHRLVCAPTTALTTGALTACFACGTRPVAGKSRSKPTRCRPAPATKNPAQWPGGWSDFKSGQDGVA